MEKDCPICGKKATIDNSEIQNYKVTIQCPYCGNYSIGLKYADEPEFTEEEKIKLKYYYATVPSDDIQRRFENYIYDEKSKVNIIKTIPAPKNLLEKIDKVLLYMSDKTYIYNNGVLFDYDISYRLFFCVDFDEFSAIKRYLLNEEYITPECTYRNNLENNTFCYALTAKGLERANKLKDSTISDNCFIAMWFNDETSEFYNYLVKAVQGNPEIEDKNSDEYGAGYKAIRIDNKNHNNYIPNEIIAEIKRCKFMIADLTGYRGGVYFEAGFAEGLGKPVIYTCNEDWFDDIKDEKGNVIQSGVHFDLKQKYILKWKKDELDEFKRTLAAKIGAIIGYNM